jgi:hypothetical protein
MVYNDAVQGLALSPYGMTDGSRYQVQHLAGQKQYELSNHLGNVQATISDLPVKAGEHYVDYHSPALPSVYDYHPFGMLMPGRYTQDTSTECVTVSQEKWVTTWVEDCYYRTDWPWPNLELIGSPTVSTTGPRILLSANTNGKGISFDLPVAAGIQQSIELDIFSAFGSSNGTFELWEENGGVWYNLGSMSITKAGNATITFTPKVSLIKVRLMGPINIQMQKICVRKPQLSQETILVDICDGDGDRYRFGFNGQEKTDEVYGKGNLNTALFWEYDTRIARRWNVDPKSSPTSSSYSTFSGNPNLFTDRLGDTTKIYGKNAALIGTINDRLPNEIHFMNYDGDADKVPWVKSNTPLNTLTAMAYRSGSAAFVGKSTIGDMKALSAYGNKNDFEVGFSAYISISREIRLLKLDDKFRDEVDKDQYDLIGALQATYGMSEQQKLFGAGHVHLTKSSMVIPEHRFRNLGTPTITYIGNNEVDYQPALYRLNDKPWTRGQSPLFIIHEFGFTIYDSGSSYSPPSAPNKVKPREESYYKYEFSK